MEQEILKRLDLLAGRLGIAATQIWQFTVRQAWVGALSSLLWLVSLLAVFIVSYRLFRGAWRNLPDDMAAYNSMAAYNDYNGAMCISIIVLSGAGMLITGIASISLLSGIVTRLLNPQYWAFQEILRQIT